MQESSRAAPHATPTRRRIALAAGGTGGHVYPAVAVAEAFAARCEPAEVFFIGSHAGVEAGVVAHTPYPFYAIAAAPVFGVGVRGQAHMLRSLAAGIVQGRRLLMRQRPDAVIGFGGYVCAGSLIAARSLRIPTALHEANAVPGLANQLLARVVDRVYLGMRAAWQPRTAVFTGNPVRAQVRHAAAATRRPPDGSRPYRILVIGGSLGSPFLNRHAPDLLQRLQLAGMRVEVRHQTGPTDAVLVDERYGAAGIAHLVTPYIDDVAEAYMWADVALTTAGAATLAELSLTGLPGVLVPLSHAARDHQTENAVAFGNATAAPWMRESDWNLDDLSQRITGLLGDRERWIAASRTVAAAAVSDAAERLAADCIAMVEAMQSRRRARC